MTPAFDQPALLLLFPLLLLPLWRGFPRREDHAWLAMIPWDPVSNVLGWAVRMVGAVAVTALILALSGLHLPDAPVQRVGHGAQIVLLLDRSRSMDQPFIPVSGTWESGGASKAQVAQHLLAQFAAQRPQDLFGMIVFSTVPIRILDFTQKQEVIQAAILAGKVGRGIADTDVGRALLAALATYDNRPYNGSRVILLVSDGGAHIDEETRRNITQEMKRQRAALYWIYIRSFRSPGLLADADVEPEHAETVPEHFLHRFFSQLGTPYHAYEAENPDALARAIADVSTLERLPITYTEVGPRRDLSQYCYATAVAALLLLLLARTMEVPR
jgi:mxaC protein